MPDSNTEPQRPATSSARVTANRRNARLSTGPKTEEGKARSSMNATKIGLYARTEIPLNFAPFFEDVDELEDFQADILSTLRPRNAMEAVIAARIRRTLTQLERFNTAEDWIYLGLDAFSALEDKATGADRSASAEREAAELIEQWYSDPARRDDRQSATADSGPAAGDPDMDWQSMARLLRKEFRVAVAGLWDDTCEPRTTDEWRRAFLAIAGHAFTDSESARLWAGEHHRRAYERHISQQAKDAMRVAPRYITRADDLIQKRARVMSELERALQAFKTARAATDSYACDDSKKGVVADG